MAKLFLAKKKSRELADDAVSRIQKTYPNKGKLLVTEGEGNTFDINLEIDQIDVATENSIRTEAQARPAIPSKTSFQD